MDGSQELFLQSSVINKLVVPIKLLKKKNRSAVFCFLTENLIIIKETN